MPVNVCVCVNVTNEYVYAIFEFKCIFSYRTAEIAHYKLSRVKLQIWMSWVSIKLSERTLGLIIIIAIIKMYIQMRLYTVSSAQKATKNFHNKNFF